jgi:hypothetical protein
LHGIVEIYSPVAIEVKTGDRLIRTNPFREGKGLSNIIEVLPAITVEILIQSFSIRICW